MTAFRKAERKKAKLRCGISGPSGSGKTYSALLLAFGLGGKVALIDTENGSGDLYAHLGEYDVLTIKSPFTPDKYIEGIKAAEKAGYGTIIIDSLTHAWSGEGGLLDMQGKIADSGKGNSYTAWRTITPKHNALVEAMLQSSCHIIATMRSKTEYVLEKNNKGQDVPKKVGMAPIQRDGMEYEFTVFFDVSIEHIASSSKDRTSLFDGKYFKPTPETGQTLLGWLNSGTEPAPPAAAAPPAEAKATTASPPSAAVPPGTTPSVETCVPPDEDPFPIEEADLITDPQVKKIQTLFTNLGVKDREAKRSWVKSCLGLTNLNSIKDLTKNEASRVIDSLEGAERTKGAA